jgi:hypothetical protein
MQLSSAQGNTESPIRRKESMKARNFIDAKIAKEKLAYSMLNN